MDNVRLQNAGYTSKSYLYKSQLHASKLLKELQLMRKQRVLCDVTLMVGEFRVDAHRIVLSSCSDYFRSMFTRNFKERNETEIILNGIESQIFEQLIEFLYSGQIHLRDENVSAILSAANLLQITEVKDACSDFLRTEILDPSNCFSIRALANLNDCKTLVSNVNLYIQRHFTQLIKENEFMELSMKDISDLIQDDNIVSDESEVFNCVMNWIKYDIQNRKSFLPSLMQHIRLPFLKLEFIALQLKEERLLHEIPECLKDVTDTLLYMLLNRNKPLTTTSKRTTPRQPLRKAIVMICTGSRSVECSELDTHKFIRLNRMPTEHEGSAVALANGLLYVLGGSQHNNEPTNTVNVYNPITDEWAEGVPMISERKRLGAASLNGKIYAVGGINSSMESCNTAEVFDPESRSWKPIAPMLTPRRGHRLAAVNNRLYAVGGYDGVNYLKTAECYDPETNKWHFISEMSCIRNDFHVGVLNGLLYVVGGVKDVGCYNYRWNNDDDDRDESFKSVEVYDPNTDSWRFVADMIDSGSTIGVISHIGQLYAVSGGGCCKVYDPETDKWTKCHEELPYISSGTLIALINRPLYFD